MISSVSIALVHIYTRSHTKLHILVTVQLCIYGKARFYDIFPEILVPKIKRHACTEQPPNQWLTQDKELLVFQRPHVAMLLVHLQENDTFVYDNVSRIKFLLEKHDIAWSGDEEEINSGPCYLLYKCLIF